jgi:hypothetical protein
MKHKPIRIDWDELEVAFNNQNEELVYYLDLVTGHVVLEGEGEEDAFDDEDQHYNQAAAAAPPRDDTTRAYVDPLDTQRKLEWMRDFLSEAEGVSTEAIAELTVALDDDDDPTAAIIAVLREHADARDRWYLYRAEQLRELMVTWLDERGITVIDPPPWKT